MLRLFSIKITNIYFLVYIIYISSERIAIQNDSTMHLINIIQLNQQQQNKYLYSMSYTNVVFQQNIARSVNREQIERARINDRIGFQSKFQTAGNLIFKPPQQSTHHITGKFVGYAEQERFNRNFDVNDKIRRNNDRQKQSHFYDSRLQKRLGREEKRWDDVNKKQQVQTEKRLYHQKVLLQNKRNSNGLGYNPITQVYQQSQRGDRLKDYDEKKQVNRYVRSKNIVQKTNRDYNIITGELKKPFNEIIPDKLQQKVNEKYENKKNREAVKYQPIRDKYDYLDD